MANYRRQFPLVYQHAKSNFRSTVILKITWPNKYH